MLGGPGGNDADPGHGGTGEDVPVPARPRIEPYLRANRLPAAGEVVIPVPNEGINRIDTVNFVSGNITTTTGAAWRYNTTGIVMDRPIWVERPQEAAALISERLRVEERRRQADRDRPAPASCACGNTADRYWEHAADECTWRGE